MKKSFLFAALTGMALMTACSNNEISEAPGYDGSNAIDFTPLASKQTRALPIDGSTILNQAIMLKAYKTEEKDYKDFTDQPQAWIDGNLTYQTGQTAGAWFSDHTYYWPSNGAHKLSFFSYAPAKNGEAGDTNIAFIDPVGYNGNVTYPAFDYTVANKVGDQKDLIVAATMNKVRTATSGTTDAVTLNHKHTLTQVYFNAKANDNNYKFKISSLKVKGAKNKGTFTYDGTADNVGNWSNLSGSASHIYRSTASADFFTHTTATRVYADDSQNGVFMLLPQPAADNLILEVMYTTYTSSGAVLVKDMVKTAKMEPLLRGKKYVYTLMLSNDESLKPIEFKVEVANWETEENIDIKFETYKIVAAPKEPGGTGSEEFANNAKYIQAMIKTFVDAARTNPFTYTLEASDELKGALAIDFTDLNPVTNTPPVGSKIILDFNAVTGWSATNKVTITGLPTGWKASAAELTGAGTLTIIKE